MRVVSSRRFRALASDVATTVLMSAVEAAALGFQGSDTAADGALSSSLDARTLSFLEATPHDVSLYTSVGSPAASPVSLRVSVYRSRASWCPALMFMQSCEHHACIKNAIQGTSLARSAPDLGALRVPLGILSRRTLHSISFSLPLSQNCTPPSKK